MTIAERTTTRRAGDASRQARRNKEAAGRRVDEIGAVTDIGRDYHAADAAGDLEMESQFQRLYAVADDDEEREAVAGAFAVWMRTERIEELALTTSVENAATLLRENNPFWLGAAVPPGSDGAA